MAFSGQEAATCPGALRDRVYFYSVVNGAEALPHCLVDALTVKHPAH